MANRIREFRERARLSMQALADRAGTTASQINKLEKGERRLTVDWMVRLARALEIDPKELVEFETYRPPGGGISDAGLPRTLTGTPIDLGTPDLPVLGRAQGGPQGVLMIPVEQQPVDWTYRPPQLRKVKDAFAVFAYDDSMHPMYKHGQVLWVHPHMPIKPGDGVLVVKQSDEALIKEFVRRSDAEIVLRQYRPREEEFSLATRDVRMLYRVIGALDIR
jgi:phage repressor protein C with HTH and peptisase S24 domain